VDVTKLIFFGITKCEFVVNRLSCCQYFRCFNSKVTLSEDWFRTWKKCFITMCRLLEERDEYHL